MASNLRTNSHFKLIASQPGNPVVTIGSAKQGQTLSIVIPCYNEQDSILELLNKVISLQLPGFTKEVIVIDDKSTDDTRKLLKQIISQHPHEITLLQQPQNLGKGAAIRRGFTAARGDLIVIQDADLEYNPEDFNLMVPLFNLNGVDVVFGSRRLLLGNNVSGTAEYWGAQIINLFTNLLYGARITDQFTCYKMYRRQILQEIPLYSNGFEIDAELTSKTLRKGFVVQEVPISYNPRSRAEGKKIRWRDGVAWLWQIIKHRFSNQSKW